MSALCRESRRVFQDMQLFGIPNVYVAIGAGLIIWWTGQKWAGNKKQGERPSRLGSLLSFAGLVVFAAGMYAGFKGPLTIAGVTLEAFPFSKMMDDASAEALAYAKGNLEINREPAPGWHGSSKTALQYKVKNNGNRTVRLMSVRVGISNGSTVEIPVDGPFPAKTTTSSVVNAPSTLSASYLNHARASSGEIVSARF
jgi:hypothetical protein